MVQFKRNLLSVALVSAMGMASGQVHAQATPQPRPVVAPVEADEEAAPASADDLDAVVITGIRRGIEDAIQTKQANSSIVEAISAEDIGKLPDTSIADSISRLPGLTAQRFGGRPQEINIRGFSGDFSTTTLNGREQVSPGNNRGVEFDQYPSELVSQVVVYKTQDASLIGQGLSGTVDLQTVSPLSFPNRVIAVNARGDMNDLDGEKSYGNRFSVSYIDQFADRTVGLALGYARLNNPVMGRQFEAWGYDGGVLGGGKLYEIENDNTRDGFVGVLEFRPNDDYRTRLDLFYSKFDKEETKRGMEFGLVYGPPGQPLSRTNNAQGTAVQASFRNFDPVIRNDLNTANDDLFSLGWNHELTLSENWTMSADISTSSATRDETILETYSGLRSGLAGDTVSIALNPDGYFDFDFGYDYGDPNILRLTDPGGWGQDGYVKEFRVKDALNSVRFDFERSFDDGVLSSIEFGANLTSRRKSRSSNENFLCLGACRDGREVAIPADLGTGSSFNFAGLPALFGYDANGALNTLYNRRANSNNGDINQKNWQVNERVTTAYVQANLDFDIGSVPVTGNVGVQAVNAEQSSTGVQTFQGITLANAASSGANYTDYLPSLNLKFGLPWESFIRVGAGKQLARPRMDDLRANVNYGIDLRQIGGVLRPVFTGGGGNTELQPWEADAYDLSFEKYFSGNKGYVSAGYFYKDLKTYIYNEVTSFDFSELLPPGTPITGPLPRPTSNIGEVSQPVNGEGGTIEGFELAVSVPLDLIWAPLEGFGISANYSEVDSEIQPFGPGTSSPLPGLSKYISNATAYFERWGFSTRLSRRSRSDFFGEVQGFGGDRVRRVFEGEQVFDFQMGYTFQDGPLKDLSLLLQVNNLKNEPFKSNFDGRADRPREFFEYGRTYLLGVNYRF